MPIFRQICYMKSLVQIEAIVKTILNYCAFLTLVSIARVGHAEDQRPRDIKVYQEYFKDILLVIYYSHPHYETIDFELLLYSPVFKNIVFYGDRMQYADSEFDHEYEDGDHGNVRIVYTRHGYYLSKWIKDVLTHYPGYKGYLFMQDDVLMQFWHFLNLDKNKIWFGTNIARHSDFEKSLNQNREWINSEHVPRHYPHIMVNQTTDSQYTHWFNTGCGMPQLKKMFADLLRLGLYEERAMLSANFKENGAAWYFVDFFYLPGRFAKKALRLCDLFHRVVGEIAVPTMLGAMDYLQNWEELPFWWDSNSVDRLKNEYEPHYYWLHPLKFSYERNRTFAWELFQEQFYNILK